MPPRRRFTGAKRDTEVTDSRFSRVVEERSIRGEGVPKGAHGLYGSEYAGVSNDNG